MKISLVIPCHSLHIKYLANLFEELKLQTEKPDEIILIISSLEEFPINNEDKITIENYKHYFNLMIKYYQERQYVHQNREIGFNLASKDILILQDADDIPHPQRIEIIKYFFEKYEDCNYLLHGCLIQNEGYNQKNNKIDIENIKIYKYPLKNFNFKKRKDKIVHYGAISIKKNFIKNIPWNNWDHLQTGHDILMCNYLAEKYNKTYWIKVNEIYCYRNEKTSWNYYRNREKEQIKKIITGEKIQMLCDEYFGRQKDFNFNPNIKKQLKITSKCIDIVQLEKQYNNKKIIFIYSHCLKEEFLKNLQNPFILVTHNSDENITEEKYQYLLTIPNLIKLYSQNCTILNSKVEQIPISIANSQWSHGKLNLLSSIILKENKKENNFFFNFSLKTNKKARKRCKRVLIKKKNLIFLSKQKQKEYLETLSTYKYCICPEGNGLDTHRFWECLYLGVIPITLKNNMILKFSERYPIVILDKWRDFNKEKLLEDYSKILNSKQDYKKYLDFNYYEKLLS